MAVLLKLHKWDGRSVLGPELVAALASLCVLSTVGLSTRNALLVAGIASSLTWLWTWRTLLDREMQILVDTGDLPVLEAPTRWSRLIREME